MKSFSYKRSAFLLAWSVALFANYALAQGELRFCLRSEPKTFDPLKVEDDASVAVRYLTGGVLVRMNRQTQALESELAQSWKVSKDGKQITFKLRSAVQFSDGTPFSAEDVAFTVQQLMDPALHSPTGDAFRSGPGKVDTKILSPTQIAITFPAPVAGLDRQFDQVAILSAHSAKKEMAVLGPFMVADYKAGSTLLLKKNPNYWKSDAQGRKLPYLDSIRLDIQPNRDVEMLRFKRNEIDLINSLDSEYFDKLATTSPQVYTTPDRLSIANRCGSTKSQKLHCRRTRRTGFGQQHSGEPSPKRSIAMILPESCSADTRSPPSVQSPRRINSGSTPG